MDLDIHIQGDIGTYATPQPKGARAQAYILEPGLAGGKVP